MDDALAAAGLLARFWSVHPTPPPSWLHALAAAAAAKWVPEPTAGTFRPVTRSDQILRRASERPPLVRLVDSLPRGRGPGVDAYLGVLDRILEDRYVSDTEMTTVSGLAAQLDLTQEAAEAAHKEYVRSVCLAAWRDGRVTDAERTDLLEVARLLGVVAEDALAMLAETAGSSVVDRPGRYSDLAPVIVSS